MLWVPEVHGGNQKGTGPYTSYMDLSIYPFPGFLLCAGSLRTSKQFKEFRFSESPCPPPQRMTLRIDNDRNWGSPYLVASRYLSRFRVTYVNCHRDELRIDHCRHLFISPHFAFHNATGNTPLPGEVKDDWFASVNSLLPGHIIIVRPCNAIGRNIKAIPGVSE